MGQAVEAVAAERGHRVVARFDAETPLLDARDDTALHGGASPSTTSTATPSGARPPS